MFYLKFFKPTAGAFLVSLTLLSAAWDLRAAPPPNLVIILADDMGYSDPGCYGGEIPTPSLDRMAEEGVRLSRFHNGGMCVISRAMMLTGQWWPKAVPDAGFAKAQLLPESLKVAGYQNALIGKWHLPGHPMDRGFDHFFGFLTGFADHYQGAPSYQLDRQSFTDFPADYYSTPAFTRRAVDFIRGVPSPKSFLLYLSYQAPHNPLQAPREAIMRHRGKYADGWQAVREARFVRQKKLGLVPADAVLPAYPENLPDWKSLTAEQRDLEELRMAVYAAMIEEMDRGIGQVMQVLRETGRAENTLVLFMSDNGADPFSVADAAMLKQGKLPGDRGSNWQPGNGWAYACNTPWRLHKISQHAGGITTGAIAWWPGGRTGRAGRIDSRPLHVVDILPGFLELAGVPVPASAEAGESFVPVLEDQSWKRRNPLFFQYMDNRAIRNEEWTLTEADGTGWELFRTADDPLETTNLVSKHPEIVRALAATWEQWWTTQSGRDSYQPTTTRGHRDYHPQGDRGTGMRYVPSAMPASLAGRYPVP